MEQIPPLIHADRMPPKQILAKKPLDEDAIADLDSPSLSDTQVNTNIFDQEKTRKINSLISDCSTQTSPTERRGRRSVYGFGFV